MNESLSKMGRDYLKELLSQCTDPQQLMFKRMYAHKYQEKPINECVDLMDDEKIDWAISQCERAVEKNSNL